MSSWRVSIGGDDCRREDVKLVRVSHDSDDLAGLIGLDEKRCDDTVQSTTGRG